MSVLPRHPLVIDALGLARTWCAGRIIDNAPAFGHALRVATVLGRHLEPAPAELLAAALLHDAPDFAPPGIDLDTVLTARFGPAITRTVRELEREHAALNDRAEPDVAGVTDWTLYASTADKIVSLSSIVRRASRAPDPAAYWHRRPAFVARVPYFIAFAELASPRLPPGMAAELQHIVARAVREVGRPEDADNGRRAPIR